jgi:hypothetical protein
LKLLGQVPCNKREIIIPVIESILKERYPNAFNNIEDTPNVGEHFINIREKWMGSILVVLDL